MCQLADKGLVCMLMTSSLPFSYLHPPSACFSRPLISSPLLLVPPLFSFPFLFSLHLPSSFLLSFPHLSSSFLSFPLFAYSLLFSFTSFLSSPCPPLSSSRHRKITADFCKQSPPLLLLHRSSSQGATTHDVRPASLKDTRLKVEGLNKQMLITEMLCISWPTSERRQLTPDDTMLTLPSVRVCVHVRRRHKTCVCIRRH